MEKVFFEILDRSILVGWIVLLILGIRLFLKKVPKIYSYILWGVVWIRLLYPVNLESSFSLLPEKLLHVSSFISQEFREETGNFITDNQEGEFLKIEKPWYIKTKPSKNQDIMQETTVLQMPQIANEDKMTNGLENRWIFIIKKSLTGIWLAGIFIFAGFSFLSFFNLKRKLYGAKQIGGNIYELEGAPSPFIFGIFQPRIYLPEGLSEEEKEYIILHEHTHIRRCDPLIKGICYILLCFHWFNPLIWVAFSGTCKDMEMSCDENVIHKMGGEIKKAYSNSLLDFATGSHMPNGILSKFGDGDTKRRIHNVLHYRKPTFLAITITASILIFASIGLITNPKSSEAKETTENGKDKDIFTWNTITNPKSNEVKETTENGKDKDIFAWDTISNIRDWNSFADITDKDMREQTGYSAYKHLDLGRALSEDSFTKEFEVFTGVHHWISISAKESTTIFITVNEESTSTNYKLALIEGDEVVPIEIGTKEYRIPKGKSTIAFAAYKGNGSITITVEDPEDQVELEYGRSKDEESEEESKIEENKIEIDWLDQEIAWMKTKNWGELKSLADISDEDIFHKEYGFFARMDFSYGLGDNQIERRFELFTGLEYWLELSSDEETTIEIFFEQNKEKEDGEYRLVLLKDGKEIEDITDEKQEYVIPKGKTIIALIGYQAKGDFKLKFKCNDENKPKEISW